MFLIETLTIILSLVFIGLGLTAQVRKNYLRKNADGLSSFYFFILSISYSFWVLYGFLQSDLALIIPMFVGALVSWIPVFQIFTYNK